MKFRRAIKEDIDYILTIISQAQTYFKEKGINQWQNNYPNIETISNDIANHNSYVLLKGNNIVATVAISFNGEKTYNSIYEGNWISNNEYAVIHRVAVDDNYKGLGLSSKIIENVESICLNKCIYSIKVDTHEENLSMQNLLKKNKFQYCGIIYLEDGSKRIAFEKVLQYTYDCNIKGVLCQGMKKYESEHYNCIYSVSVNGEIAIIKVNKLGQKQWR